jgi:hypothetical protein
MKMRLIAIVVALLVLPCARAGLAQMTLSPATIAGAALPHLKMTAAMLAGCRAARSRSSKRTAAEQAAPARPGIVLVVPIRRLTQMELEKMRDWRCRAFPMASPLPTSPWLTLARASC